MESVTIYEYLVDKDEIIKVVHSAKIQGDRYVFKAGKSECTHKILHYADLDVTISNHIFSLRDDFSKYEKMLIDEMEKRYLETESMQIRRKAVIDKLKKSVQQSRGRTWKNRYRSLKKRQDLMNMS